MATIKLVVYVSSPLFDEEELSVVAYNAIEFGLKEGSLDFADNSIEVESDIYFEEVDNYEL